MKTQLIDENSDTMVFQCGCFVTWWVEEGALKSAMANCQAHDRPYQSLESLGKTHDFRIEKKYTPRDIASVDEQLEQLKGIFPIAAISEPNVGGDRWVSFECPIWGWNKPKTLVHFRIVTPGYPFMSPDGGDAYQLFRCDGDLRLSHGGLANRTYRRESGGNTYTLFGGELCAWNPMHDTLLTYARVCKIALQKMGAKEQ